MTTTTEYRAMAEECFQWARVATTDSVRSAYLEIAKIWLAMAAVRQDGSCQYDTLTVTLTPLSLFLPEGRSANFASEPACPAPAHHEKPPSPHDGRGPTPLAGDDSNGS
jgi:hypothetical protein